MQNSFQQLGFVAVVLASVAMVRVLLSNEKSSSLPATLVVLFVGYFLAGNGHWPAGVSAAAIAVAFIVYKIFAVRKSPADPSKHPSLVDHEI